MSLCLCLTKLSEHQWGVWRWLCSSLMFSQKYLKAGLPHSIHKNPQFSSHTWQTDKLQHIQPQVNLELMLTDGPHSAITDHEHTWTIEKKEPQQYTYNHITFVSFFLFHKKFWHPYHSGFFLHAIGKTLSNHDISVFSGWKKYRDKTGTKPTGSFSV